MSTWGMYETNSRTDENCSYAVGIFDSPQTTRCTKGEGPFRYSLVSMSSKAANCNQWCLRQLFFCDLLFSKIWFAHIFTFCWQHVWEERCGLAWMATWMCSIVFLVDSGGGGSPGWWCCRFHFDASNICCTYWLGREPHTSVLLSLHHPWLYSYWVAVWGCSNIQVCRGVLDVRVRIGLGYIWCIGVVA